MSRHREYSSLRTFSTPPAFSLRGALRPSYFPEASSLLASCRPFRNFRHRWHSHSRGRRGRGLRRPQTPWRSTQWVLPTRGRSITARFGVHVAGRPSGRTHLLGVGMRIGRPVRRSGKGTSPTSGPSLACRWTGTTSSRRGSRMGRPGRGPKARRVRIRRRPKLLMLHILDD